MLHTHWMSCSSNSLGPDGSTSLSAALTSLVNLQGLDLKCVIRLFCSKCSSFKALQRRLKGATCLNQIEALAAVTTWARLAALQSSPP